MCLGSSIAQILRERGCQDPFAERTKRWAELVSAHTTWPRLRREAWCSGSSESALPGRRLLSKRATGEDDHGCACPGRWLHRHILRRTLVVCGTRLTRHGWSFERPLSPTRRRSRLLEAWDSPPCTTRSSVPRSRLRSS